MAGITAAKCILHLEAIVLVVNNNCRKMSPDASIHCGFKTTAQLLSWRLKSPWNDLKIAAKCIFSCSDYHLTAAKC